MRQSRPKTTFLILAMAFAGVLVLPTGEAAAKRLKIWSGGTRATVVPHTARSTAAPVQPEAASDAKTPTDPAAFAKSVELARKKLATERGETEVVGGQVNSSAGIGTLTCIAGCYK